VSLQAIALCASCARGRERSAAQPYQCTRATAGVLHVQEFTRSTSAEHTLVVTQPWSIMWHGPLGAKITERQSL
jgi:hypothetical protein